MSSEKYPLNEKGLQRFSNHLSEHLLEIEKIESKLSYIVRRNSIVDIAAKVEVYQLMLDRSFQNYSELKKELELLFEKIKEKDQADMDRRTTGSYKKKMHTLSDSLADADRRFDQVKQHCDHFITDILK